MCIFDFIITIFNTEIYLIRKVNLPCFFLNQNNQLFDSKYFSIFFYTDLHRVEKAKNFWNTDYYTPSL